ncbi:putative uncharacterized protein C8orf89 homolog isoform X1 [Monodelphis domestica]|uniref:putative uncharacterized protein C8orf89 homolog isoform X1 n=1 Tax=Monodelphis domestica TaxID=13616 RepID=UPI0024E1FCDE|nr:putative uncharacterized protein C8orf89 homolog isoform X1 [Monodelphis domestica]
MPALGEANMTVCAALVTGTRLPSRATHPGPAGDSAGLRRSDPSQWIGGDGEGDGDESYTSELNYLLSTCSLKRKDRWNLQQYNVTDSQRNLSSFSKEQNKMPALTHENRYLTSRVTRSSLDGCFIFEKSWKKAVRETQKLKKEYSSIFSLEDLKEVVTIPSLPEVERYRTSTTSPIDVLKKNSCATLKTPKIRSVKSNQTGDTLSNPEKTECFKSPLTGAPPQYLQRLSQLAILEYDTIRQETSRRFKKEKKRELPDC